MNTIELLKDQYATGVDRYFEQLSLIDWIKEHKNFFTRNSYFKLLTQAEHELSIISTGNKSLERNVTDLWEEPESRKTPKLKHQDAYDSYIKLIVEHIGIPEMKLRSTRREQSDANDWKHLIRYVIYYGHYASQSEVAALCSISDRAVSDSVKMVNDVLKRPVINEVLHQKYNQFKNLLMEHGKWPEKLT